VTVMRLRSEPSHLSLGCLSDRRARKVPCIQTRGPRMPRHSVSGARQGAAGQCLGRSTYSLRCRGLADAANGRAAQEYAYAGASGLLWMAPPYWTGGIAALILS
jgi:hypothetical protein